MIYQAHFLSAMATTNYFGAETDGHPHYFIHMQSRAPSPRRPHRMPGIWKLQRSASGCDGLNQWVSPINLITRVLPNWLIMKIRSRVYNTTRLFSVEWKLLTQKSDSFWFLNQRSEWVQWALKNHSKIWFWLNPFDSFWFNQPNGLPEKSSDLCHSQVLFWESKGISYSTDDSFIHGESNYWVNDSELKTA